MAEKTALVILKEYFGYKPDTGMKEFQEEIKGLSEAEKLELAKLAAAALGHTLVIPAEKTT